MESEVLFLTGLVAVIKLYASEGSKRVVVPIHNKELPKGTFDNILKQAGIDNRIILCWHN